jgi:predicted KAP-like P-loop ATPase
MDDSSARTDPNEWLAEIGRIAAPSEKVEALVKLASQLPPSCSTMRSHVLEQALIVAQIITEDFNLVGALEAIVPQLVEAEPYLWKQALTASQTIDKEMTRADVLERIASQLPQVCIPQLFEATSGLSVKRTAKVLISPAVRFTEVFISQLPRNKHSMALEIVKSLSHDADRSKFLSALAPRLSLGLLPNALRLIQDSFTQDVYRAEAFCNLLPYLPQYQLPAAWKLVKGTIKDPDHQTTALEALIPIAESYIFEDHHRFYEIEELVKRLPRPQLQIKILKVLTTTFVAAWIDKDKEKVLGVKKAPLTIYNLVNSLKETEHGNFSYEPAVSDILSRLAPTLTIKSSDRSVGDNTLLSDNELDVILSSVKKIADLKSQSDVLIAFAPYFTEFVNDCISRYVDDDFLKFLRIKVSLTLQDKSDNSYLDSNAYFLDLRNKVEAIKGDCQKAEALVEIASNPIGLSYQAEALQTIRGLSDEGLKAKYLQRLILNLLNSQRFEAVSVIGDIRNPYYRVTARVALARKFSESEFFNAALDDASQLTSRIQKIEQLSILAIDMPELIPRIIKIAEELDIDPQIVGIEGGKVTEEEAFATKIERRDILVALAPHLPMRINREVDRLRPFVSAELYHRALYLLARGYRDALQGGTLRNDTAQDRDLLDLKDEINALSGLLLMRDLEPPMTVGILGGWGGGKSYIMHLMQQRMTDVRSGKVDPAIEAWNANPNHEKLSPYVGHIYQIKFDAWTFAKSDLWASLMQTIFFELNRQISLEQQLARVLAEHPEDPASRAKALCEAGQYWPVLYKASDQDRQWFLERVLSPAQLAKFKDIHNQGQVDDELWRQLGATYQAENQKLTELEAELHRKQDELRIKTQAVRSQVDDNQLNQLILKLTGPVSILLSNRISQPVLTRINRDITRQVKAQLSSQAAADALEPLDIEHLNATVQAVATGVFEQRYGEISFRSFLTWFKKNLRLFGLMLVFLTLAILLPIAADALLGWLLPSLDSAFPRLIAFLAPLTPGLASAQALLKSSQKWAEETNLAVKEYEQQLEALPKQLEDRREQLFQTQLDKVKEVADLEAEVKQLEEKVSAQRQRIPENVYESLEAFVSDRIQDGSYEKRLGLMQQVKGDLAELSNRLLPPPADSQEFQWKVEQLQKVFPRGPARVVVYIDDLDRCPPDRVVQVLEAVQLLVKTPLFIAVLAIDERYITRALEQFYKGVLLRHGSPSGTDYLEKIIQLPYRVRPIMANTLETYLRAQVVIQDNATGGTKFSELSRQEFNLLVDCCKQVDLSPRTLKRLTNVYKLFKIVCRTRGTKTTLQLQQAILALLALSGRYATLMRGIFADIETVFEEQRDKAKADAINAAKAKRQVLTVEQLEPKALYLQSPLKDFFEHYSLPTSDQYLQLEFDKLQHDALQTNILPAITLEAMTPEIFNLIRSFSFVGDIGEDSDDYRYGGLAQTGVSHPATQGNPSTPA